MQNPRRYGDPRSYLVAWPLDPNRDRNTEQLKSISWQTGVKAQVQLGRTVSESNSNGFYLNWNVTAGLEDKISGGIEGEYDASWTSEDTTSDSILTVVDNPKGVIGRYTVSVRWNEYDQTKKGIDCFWTPPGMRIADGYYNRPWFYTYSTGNISP